MNILNAITGALLRLDSVLRPWKMLGLRIASLEQENDELLDSLHLEIRRRVDDAKGYARSMMLYAQIEHKLGELRLFSKTQEIRIAELVGQANSNTITRMSLDNTINNLRARNTTLENAVADATAAGVKGAANYNAKLGEYRDLFIELRDQIDALTAQNKRLTDYLNQPIDPALLEGK